MSCNGCRVLRKGCSEACVLRHSLQCIDSPEAQAHATLFVTKFFGRAGLTGFINGVPENQRPALFQSLLYEACGRTVNPVYGAVGLLFSGNWAVCQAAVDTVLRGGSPKPTVKSGLHSTSAIPCNSLSALDGSAGSISTIDPYLLVTATVKPNNSAGCGMQPQPFSTTDQSFATSACSLKTNSTCHLNPNYGLDFTKNSGTSSAAHDTVTALPPCPSKRIWYCKPESVKEEDHFMFKRPRASLSFCESAPPINSIPDAAHMAISTMRPNPLASSIAAYNSNLHLRGCSQGGCEAQLAGEYVSLEAAGGQLVPEVENFGGHVVGYAPQGRTLVTPVARRVHHKDIGMSTVAKRLSSEDCDYQCPPDMPSKGDLEQHLDFASMVSSDQLVDDAMTKLNLTLKAQVPSKLGYYPSTEPKLQEGDLMIKVDRSCTGVEEPHELLRVSSPSVNSEGSVSTTWHVAGGSLQSMIRLKKSYFNGALESPKDGVKLLNLLL
ncbi:hypothetical protein L7F22_021567 [Adiantum nelumboides]|nr:hypothetical protein [Adiantum nelumboides]